MSTKAVNVAAFAMAAIFFAILTVLAAYMGKACAGWDIFDIAALVHLAMSSVAARAVIIAGGE